MKPIYLILFSLLIFATCKSPKLKYCESEYKLIQADTLPMIELDFDQSEADFETQLLKGLEVDSICEGSPNTGLSLDWNIDGFHKSFNAINVRTSFYNSCRSDIIFCGIYPNHFTIILNQENQILIGYTLIDLQKDSITKALQKEWERFEMDYSKFQESKFILKVNLPIKNTAVKSILDGFVHFYLKKMDMFCRKVYDKELCNVDKEIIKQLKADFPFQVHVCYTEYCSLNPPPPPPPPLEELEEE